MTREYTTRLIGTTTSYCPGCLATHAARYEVRNDEVVYTIGCPKHPKRTVVSTDPQLFHALRADRLGCRGTVQPGQATTRTYALPVTDHCNLECPICYAESSSHGASYLSLEQLRGLAMKIKDSGGRMLSLVGGEPTLHPDLPEMIRMVRYDVGIAPVLITNGVRIAEDPDYLLRLREAGLRRVKLQFDTFDNQTYRAMRGRHDVSEKFGAVERIVSAGMGLGLVMAVCKLNIGELGGLLDYARSLGPSLRLLQLQPMVRIGRFPANLESVTREDVIHALVQAGRQCDLREEDFLPPPRFGDGRPAAHPDCFAQVLLCIDGNQAYPLARTANTDRGRSASPSADGLSGDEPPGTHRARPRDSRRSVVLIRVIAFMRPDTRDEERIARCTTFTVNGRGIAGLCQEACNRNTRPLAARSELPAP